MKYAVGMGSGAMICIPSFIKIGSSIQNNGEGDSQTYRQPGNLMSTVSFSN
jgi:hypothetical protein